MPYPGKDGQSFFRRNGSTGDSQTLTPKKIQQGLSHETSEWHNGRLANATSFLAGNLRQLVAITNLSPTTPELTEDTQSFKRTGIPQLASYFSTSDGKKLARAARYLDFNAAEERNEEDLAVALVHLFKEVPKLSAWCQRSALYSVKLLAASLQILEVVAVVEDRDGWAESLHVQRQKQNASVLNFMRSPDDDEALLQAIIGCYGGHARKVFDSESLLDRDEHMVTMEGDDGGVPMDNRDVEQVFTPPRKLFSGFPRRCLQEVDVTPSLVCLFGDSAEPRAAVRLRMHSEADTRRRPDVSSSQEKTLTLQGSRLPGRSSSFFEEDSPFADASLTKRLREKREPLQTAVIASQRKSFFDEDVDDAVGLSASQGSGPLAPPTTPSVPTWSLESYLTFVKSHDVATCAFNFESMTQEELQALVADIPVHIRDGIAYDFGAQDPPVIDDSLACAKAVSIFIRGTVELHELRAESFRSERHRWQVDEEWFQYGFL